MEEAFWNHGKVVAATSEVSGSKAAPTGKDLRELPRTSHLNRKRFDRIDILYSKVCCSTDSRSSRHELTRCDFLQAVTANGGSYMKIHHLRLRGISDVFPTSAGHASSADASQGGSSSSRYSPFKIGAHCGSKSSRFMVEITDHYSYAGSGSSAWLSAT